MRDYPPLADHRRRHPGEDRPDLSQSRDTGLSTWLAVAAVIISLGVVLVFSQDQLQNGGAPFVITPPSQISAYPAPSL